jgi:steroid 5-alpha reductase family enzyme
MSWFECPRINVLKSSVVISIIAAAIILSMWLWSIVSTNLNMNSVDIVIWGLGILAVELTVFRFAQDAIGDRLYCNNNLDLETYLNER